MLEPLRTGDAAKAAEAMAAPMDLDAKGRSALRKRLERVVRRAGRLQDWKVVSDAPMPGGARWRLVQVVSHHEKAPVAWAFETYEVAASKGRKPRIRVLKLAFDAEDPGGFIRARAAPSAP